MIELIWLELELNLTEEEQKDKKKHVPATPQALWTLVHEYVSSRTKLKIQARGMWWYSGSTVCGPDGARKAGFSEDALNPSALLGALIGKIGGSPADKPDTRTFTFVAGSYAVVVLDEKTEGPLYLTMNDLPTRFDEHSGSLIVTVDSARSSG